MNWTETNQFLIEQVQSRWPVWKPTDMEIKDWRRVLSRYTKDVAEEAMLNYIEDAGRITRRPLIAVFITKAKLLINKTPEKEEVFEPVPGKLYGKPAQEKAFTMILGGRECAAKRWLVDYLRRNPTALPLGVTLPVKIDARGLPCDSVGSPGDLVGDVLQNTPTFLGKLNPDWVGDDPGPPPDELPF